MIDEYVVGGTGTLQLTCGNDVIFYHCSTIELIRCPPGRGSVIMDITHNGTTNTLLFETTELRDECRLAITKAIMDGPRKSFMLQETTIVLSSVMLVTTDDDTLMMTVTLIGGDTLPITYEDIDELHEAFDLINDCLY